MAVKVSVELPETANLEGADERYLQEALIATLYHLGRVSAKEGRSSLGMSRREFEEMLPRFGFSVLPDDPETIRDELSA